METVQEFWGQFDLTVVNSSSEFFNHVTLHFKEIIKWRWSLFTKKEKEKKHMTWSSQLNPSKSIELMHFVFHPSSHSWDDEIVYIRLVLKAAAHSGSVNNFISVIDSLLQ